MCNSTERRRNFSESMASRAENSDFFDLLPDPIFLLILNRVSDIKTLLHCRSVSKRFNFLVPQADSLLLRVDRVISASESAFDGVSFLSTLFKSLFTSLHHLINFPPTGKPFENSTHLQNSPSQILCGFNDIKKLRIQLPAGDLRLEKGTIIKWVAKFGRTLKSCVILAFQNSSESSSSNGGGGGLKMRVVWTISALIAASARHYMMADVVKEHHHLSYLVVNDREDEGTVIIDKEGLEELRESGDEMREEINDSRIWWRNNRTTVPAVGMRMRYEPKLELSGGMIMDGATLIVVRPISGGQRRSGVEDPINNDGLVAETFGEEGMYAEAMQKLLKSKSYILEMNSF